jgi:SAM-dependent methyltransferase
MCIPSAERRGPYSWFFAWSMAHGGRMDEKLYGERKRRLFADLAGTIVEIGAGAGPNLRYLPAGTRYVGVEPNVHFHGFLRKEAERRGIDASVTSGVAEQLPVETASADAVISTLVLCSVADQQLALAEIRRVLRPGGLFAFVEHVAAPRHSLLRKAQRGIRPLWQVMADGCTPDRETGSAIEAAGFSELRIERFEADLPLPVIRPHIWGLARL